MWNTGKSYLSFHVCILYYRIEFLLRCFNVFDVSMNLLTVWHICMLKYTVVQIMFALQHTFYRLICLKNLMISSFCSRYEACVFAVSSETDDDLKTERLFEFVKFHKHKEKQQQRFSEWPPIPAVVLQTRYLSRERQPVLCSCCKNVRGVW